MIFLEIPFLASAIILILPTAVYRISAYQKGPIYLCDLSQIVTL